MEINLRSFLSEFNGSKFVLYSSLLVFTFLLALRLDGVFSVSYYFVFVPLFVGELLVFLGFTSGFVSFVFSPPARLDAASKTDFFSMCFCTLEHVLLLMFELLLCFKLENPNGEIEGVQLSWVLVFAPLFIQSFVAMVISIWCIRNDKLFEFEMFFAVNVIQFVFLAFKLDSAMHWNWSVVFVPVWVMFSLFYVGTVYSLIITIFLSRSLHVLSTHRRSQMFSTLCHFVISIPLLMFFVLLANKLDANALLNHQSPQSGLQQQPIASVFGRGRVQLPYTLVACPLLIAEFFLVSLSFGSRSGNTWWFAIRRPFCNFLFDRFPCLQQYANISYKFGEEPPRRRSQQRAAVSGSGERLQMLHPAETSLTNAGPSLREVKCKFPRGLGPSTSRVASTSTGQISPAELMNPD